MRRPVAVAVAVAVLALSLAGCAPAPRLSPQGSPIPTERAGDTDDTTSAAFQRLNAHQEVLQRFDDWIHRQHGLGAHGYIATVDDLERTSLTLLWYGYDPWRERLVAAAPRFGVTAVHFQQRDQSLGAFVATQRRLEAVEPRLRGFGFTMTGISGIAAEPQPLTMFGRFRSGADRVVIQRIADDAAGEHVVLQQGGPVPY